MLKYNAKIEKDKFPQVQTPNLFNEEVMNYFRTDKTTKLDILTPKPFPFKKSFHLNYTEPHSTFKEVHDVDMKGPYSEPEDLKYKHSAHNEEADIKEKLQGNDKVKIKEQPNTLYYEKNLKDKDDTNLLITNWRKEEEAAHPGSNQFQSFDVAKLSKEDLSNEIRKINKNRSKNAIPIPAIKEPKEFEVPGANTTKSVKIKNKQNQPVIEIKSVAKGKTPAIPVVKKENIIEKTINKSVNAKEEEAADRLTKNLRKLLGSKKQQKQEANIVSEKEKEKRSKISKLEGIAERKRLAKEHVEFKEEEAKIKRSQKEEEQEEKKREYGDDNVKVKEEIEKINDKIKMDKIKAEYKEVTGRSLPRGKNKWTYEKYDQKIKEYNLGKNMPFSGKK